MKRLLLSQIIILQSLRINEWHFNKSCHWRAGSNTRVCNPSHNNEACGNVNTGGCCSCVVDLFSCNLLEYFSSSLCRWCCCTIPVWLKGHYLVIEHNVVLSVLLVKGCKPLLGVCLIKKVSWIKVGCCLLVNIFNPKNRESGNISGVCSNGTPSDL